MRETHLQPTLEKQLRVTVPPAPATATATDAFAGRLKTHRCVSFLAQLWRSGNSTLRSV
jgi:hypothetical protein